MSQSGDKDTGVVDAVQQAAAAAASPFSMSKPNNSDNPFIKKAATSPVTTLPSPPLRDRHVIWTKGKEVHEGTRRPSVSGEKSSDADLSTADRRRVSTHVFLTTVTPPGMIVSIRSLIHSYYDSTTLLIP